MKLTGWGYRCSAGESFDSAAAEIWGAERYADELLCANPQLSGTPVFAGGEILAIPEIETGQSDETGAPIAAPWKKG